MADYLLHGSYLAIIFVLVLTGMGLPVPEEVPIIAAGVLSAHDQLNPWLALASCVIGALLGDTASYWIGYHFGRGVLQKHRWWVRVVTPEREARIERMIRSHGFKVFFVARFLIGFRSAIYLTAGVLRMSFVRFILIDAACASVIIAVFFGLSYWFGDQVRAWIQRGEWALTAAVAAGLVVAGVVVWYRSRRKLIEAVEGPTEATPAQDPAPPPPGNDRPQ